jgi:hypothetical protein
MDKRWRSAPSAEHLSDLGPVQLGRIAASGLDELA